ncbi:MAG: response regulator transcription factor [Chloroflexi bacterium]|nr:response regulator transcription factor [Chloroflexota bacterium]
MQVSEAIGNGRRWRVLVVDDEPTVREVVSRYLEREGYRVDSAADGDSARRLFAESPDLVVLDLTLPGMDGLAFLRDIRRTSAVPVILLTARTEEMDRVVGLELGADDYVVKPFSPRELVARVRSVLRRGRAVIDGPRLEFADLSIDARARTVTVRGKTVPFRAREFDLLHFLASSPHQVFSRAQLLNHVWESSAEFSDVSTVTVHVRRIRQKIENDPLEPRRIVTIRGVGYRFDP